MTTQNRSNSENLYHRACAVIPGGVNSPVRAFKGVGGTPIFVSRAEGPYLFDVDGNRYIDFVGSWGPMVLGHRAEVIETAIREALPRGVSYGAPTESEIRLAELICELVPSIEMVRMVNSGTEATMSALRLARAFTKRDYIIKFNGCYHGHGDSLLVQAGSGVATLGIPGSPGVPAELAKLTATVEYNDLPALESLVERVGGENVAAMIIEPVIGNSGLILPQPGFLAAVRALCDQHRIVLIFDEVMTGFRVAMGGAQARYGITPDLTTLGKVIGGGLPVGAYGGRREIMSLVAPQGPVYQAGTLSGNPVAMAAGIAALGELKRLNPFPVLEERGKRWAQGMREGAAAVGISLQAESCGSMLGFFFSPKPITNFSEAKTSDVDRFKRFFQAMLNRGVYLAPSAFEAGFIGVTHTDEILAESLTAARAAFAEVA